MPAGLHGQCSLPGLLIHSTLGAPSENCTETVPSAVRGRTSLHLHGDPQALAPCPPGGNDPWCQKCSSYLGRFSLTVSMIGWTAHMKQKLNVALYGKESAGSCAHSRCLGEHAAPQAMTHRLAAREPAWADGRRLTASTPWLAGHAQW